jgi:hypothetical protein
VEFAAELQASLREFTASGVVEVRENGGRVAPFSGMSWEVRGNGEKPLLHLWSDEFNLTRRVLAITDRSEQRLALAVERFGRAKPDRLEFIRREFERGPRELSREEFRDRLTHLLAEQFPDETLESLVTSPDLEHSFSGNYARGVLRRGSTHVAVLAAPGGESSDAVGNSLLDQRFVYAQVFANAGGEHGILDLLTVTRSGRLAVIELKASEHIHLPLQAADYWLRVRRQLQNAEVARYGYFQGVALQQAPPLVYLVAPALRFHPATDGLLKYLSPELEIARVGIAESWRRGLRVVMRQ